MSENLFISSNVSCGILTVKNVTTQPQILDEAGKVLSLPVLRQTENSFEYNASDLSPWSPDSPVLYTLVVNGESCRFGYVDIRQAGATLLVNDTPYYFRGYIRGIKAHEHPNMTGGSRSEYFRKNIRQAKKYGFNLVRFHSVIPEPEFVELADELGLFVHIEVGYRYEFDSAGKKQGIIIDEQLWRDALIRYRNHPSVAIFCLGNEMHNSGHNPEARRMYDIGKKLAPGKLILDNAGWGEFDRESSDIFIQHIAYYFPYRHHAAMFNEDFFWEMNGSVKDISLTSESSTPLGTTMVRRRLNPVRPVLAHECIHYIDIPDYEELNRKFDDFAARVGQEYLDTNGITKPRYLTALPQLIADKGLEDKLPDYIAASQHFKKLGMKIYLERLRLASGIAGFEMLQFADCLKYENKNGIVDCFDDDKFIDAEWFLGINNNVVLLAEFPETSFCSGEAFRIGLSISNYAIQPLGRCELKLSLNSGNAQNSETIFQGTDFLPLTGVSKLLDATLIPQAESATQFTLCTELQAADGRKFRNQWIFHVYPKPQLEFVPALVLSEPEPAAFLSEAAKHVGEKKDFLLTDVLDTKLFNALESGQTVILNYHRDRQGNSYYLPGTIDRFKPCIWDRGSHLGGVINSAPIQEAMGSGRYFDINFYHLVEGAYKINLDHYPFKVDELIWGVDKPVRDRMKGLIHGVKDFIQDDTLRNFSYLFGVKVGLGTLYVCTFRFDKAAADPATSAFLVALLRLMACEKPQCAVPLDEFKRWVEQTTTDGIIKEDVMNHFWEIDNKPVEDTLFWEEARVDLSRSKGSESTRSQE